MESWFVWIKEWFVDMKLAEEAMKEIMEGRCRSRNADEFLKDMKAWAEKKQ